MNTSTEALKNGGHVVIIGGGPGGTACALALKRLAKEMQTHVEVTILEGKQFIEERHHNQCVGVLSPPLPELLEEQLGVPFPRHLCLVDIDGYVLHTSKEKITLGGEEDGSVAVRRVHFDAYMLEQVKKHEITVEPMRAVDLEFHDDHVLIYTENEPLEADIVIGAFGMDEGSIGMFSRNTSYRPPKAIDSIVTRYKLGAECMAGFGTKIYAFLPADPHIEFGAVTPKCDHLTINIAGTHVDSVLMRKFLEHPRVMDALPKSGVSCSINTDEIHYYKGRFPRSLASGFYGDRYVMIGDASGLVRAFKGKGSTTAMITGIRAAETIMQEGISKQAFRDSYRRANQDIIGDLPYGQAMRMVTIYTSRLRLLNPVIRAAHETPRLRDALYDAVSGHGDYRDVLKDTLRPSVILAILKAFFLKTAT